MAHFIRGKQAGVQNDFSADIEPELFVVEELKRYGIAAQIREIAYDPVQSLFAGGTARTSSSPGIVYVFGRGRISCTFTLQSPKASVRVLQFCADKLLCLDDANDLTIFNLETRTKSVSYSPPGTVTAMASDATLDYVMLGMASGEVIAYDMDRLALSPFRLPCLWADKDPRARHVSVETLEFHPRDVGKLLIGYMEGAVIFSFKQNEPRKFYQYHVPRGAPGGDADPAAMNLDRRPKLTGATWHPTGTFVLTYHDDSSLAVWDPKDGRLITARTTTDTHVHEPAPGMMYERERGNFAVKTPLLKVKWCANQDPDDTAILVAGGTSTASPIQGLSLLELGRTPNYTTSSWVQLAAHFDNPRRQRVLPTPPQVEVVNFCLVPRTSPWFAGAHDPIAILALFSTGEVTTLSFPSGYPITSTNQLPLSMSFIHPFTNCIGHSTMERGRWLGMTENRSSGPKFLVGGAEATRPLKRFETRSIVHTAHADGSIRLWDAGHLDQVENESMLQADVSRALGRMDGLNITKTALSGASGELAAGLQTGEVVVFRWMRNKHPGEDATAPKTLQPKALTNVSDRMDPSLIEGFQPFTVLNQQDGPCTALQVSDVGFIAAGFKSGSVAVIDMRGPAVIFSNDIGGFTQKHKGGSLKRRSGSNATSVWPTSLEFSVMTLEDENYSSILLHVGTSAGQIATFKVLPGQGGRYSVAFAGASAVEDPVICIAPINASTGHLSPASQQAVAGLRDGFKVDGVLLAVTKTGARIFRAPSAKGGHKSWDGALCEAAAVVKCLDTGVALVGAFGDGTVKAFSLPGLKEIASSRIGHILDVKRLDQAVITPSGEIISWTGPSEISIAAVWASPDVGIAEDRIFNPEALIPPRPTISNFQWVSGTQYITPADLDILIGGTDRPPSKRQQMMAREDEIARRQAARQGAAVAAPPPAPQGSNETYLAYAQRQMNERMERLGTMNETMDRLGETSSGWADDVNKFVSRQKRNMVMGAVKSKFGM